MAGVIAIALLAAGALAGCDALGGPVTDKTNAILKQLSALPGVVASTSTQGERSLSSEPHSELKLEVAADATAAQLDKIVTTFAHANVETGLDKVVSELDLAAQGTTDTLQLLYGKISDAQATTLADSWLDLRGRYTSTALGLVISSGTDYIVNLSVGLGQSSFEGDLTALHDAQADFAKLGDVGRYDQVDGRFAASGGLPDDTMLAQLVSIEAVLTADGTEPDLRGEYDGLTTSFSLVAAVADSTDAGNGLNAAAVRLLDTIPAAGAGITVKFVSATDRHEIATFDDRSCDSYVGLAAGDPSVQLLAYWARDGRTLRDGSTAESCNS